MFTLFISYLEAKWGIMKQTIGNYDAATNVAKGVAEDVI